MEDNTSTAPLAALERDLVALEGRLTALVAYAQELRLANETLRRELAESAERHRVLTDAVAVAARRVDALLERLPEASE